MVRTNKTKTNPNTKFLSIFQMVGTIIRDSEKAKGLKIVSFKTLLSGMVLYNWLSYFSCLFDFIDDTK